MKVELFNLMGEFVLSEELSQSTSLVDLSALTNGVYLCKVSDENGFVTTERIVKN